MRQASRRLVAIAALAVAPWTVVFTYGTPTLFFPFGFVTLDPLSSTWIWDYYLRYTVGLPQYLVAYGVGVLLLGVAAVSSATAFLGREDERVTAAVLLLAGVSNGWFALGFVRRPGSVYVAVPVGTVLLWTLVWWSYADAIRRLFTFSVDSS